MNAALQTRLDLKREEIWELYSKQLWSIKLLSIRFNVKDPRDMGDYILTLIEGGKTHRRSSDKTESDLAWKPPTWEEMQGDLVSIENDLYQNQPMT